MAKKRYKQIEDMLWETGYFGTVANHGGVGEESVRIFYAEYQSSGGFVIKYISLKQRIYGEVFLIEQVGTTLRFRLNKERIASYNPKMWNNFKEELQDAIKFAKGMYV